MTLDQTSVVAWEAVTAAVARLPTATSFDEVTRELTAVLRGMDGVAAGRAATRLNPTDWGEICADFQSVLLALRGAAKGMPPSEGPDDDLFREFLLRGLGTGDEVALLLAAGHPVGAWARWRALFEMAVLAEFIDRAPGRVPTDAHPLATEERSWRALPDEIRREGLVAQFIRQRDVAARKRAEAEQRWAKASGLPVDPRLVAEAALAAELASDLDAGDYAWAFPHSPRRVSRRFPTLLAALEADPGVVVRRATGERVETHLSRSMHWQLASEAAHRTEIRPRTIPVFHSQVLEEAGRDMATLANLALIGAVKDARALLYLIGCLSAPGRRLGRLVLEALDAASDGVGPDDGNAIED